MQVQNHGMRPRQVDMGVFGSAEIYMAEEHLDCPEVRAVGMTGFGPCMDGSPLARVLLSALQLLVGAAMYPTCRCGPSYAAGHNAIRAAQVPIESSHSKVHGPIGFS